MTKTFLNYTLNLNYILKLSFLKKTSSKYLKLTSSILLFKFVKKLVNSTQKYIQVILFSLKTFFYNFITSWKKLKKKEIKIHWTIVSFVWVKKTILAMRKHDLLFSFTNCIKLKLNFTLCLYYAKVKIMLIEQFFRKNW